MEERRKEISALGRTWIIPEITTEQYAAASEIILRNNLGNLTTDDATELLATILVEKGATAVVGGMPVNDIWTPDAAIANKPLFKFFPMEQRVEAIFFFLDGFDRINDIIKRGSERYVTQKSEQSGN